MQTSRRLFIHALGHVAIWPSLSLLSACGAGSNADEMATTEPALTESTTPVALTAASPLSEASSKSFETHLEIQNDFNTASLLKHSH